MKTLDEYRKELEQDPKARRRLKKLEKEFRTVEESLTEEELIKYGLVQKDPVEGSEGKENDAQADREAAGVIDILSHKI